MTVHIPRNVIAARKACSVNPLKMSAPLGAAMAYLGMEGCLPLFHGSQGCTAFSLVLMVRHFREAIPVQTTAMNEITTILGGLDNVEQAVVNISRRLKPRLVGICSTGLTETRGEDIGPELPAIKARNPDLADTELVFAATPDYIGGLQEGWAKAVEAIIDAFVPEGPQVRIPRQVNILAGAHLTPGDIEELRDIAAAFGLHPIVLPDLAGSLDGHVPDSYVGTSYGGTRLAEVAGMGRSAATLCMGEHLRRAGAALESRTGVPHRVVTSAMGLDDADRLMLALSDISGRPVPARFRRQRSQLVDAMLDAHFFFGGKKIALAAEPDLLCGIAGLLKDMGAEMPVAVTTVSTPALAKAPLPEIVVGDLMDLEAGAAAAGADLLITHAHGRQASARTGIPLFRLGFPQFDRLGAAHRVHIGYRGTRSLIFDLGNMLMDAEHHHTQEDGHGGTHAAAH